MKINDVAPLVTKPLADFNAVSEAPPPPEIPPEVRAGFSLAQMLDRSVKTLNRNIENGLKWSSDADQTLKNDRLQMAVQQLRACGAVMTHCIDTLPVEQRQRLYDEQNLIARGLMQMLSPAAIPDDFDVETKSSNDFFDKLLELIDLIKNGYLAGYEHIIAAYSDFFADFNAEITAKLKDWIQGANDGKEVRLNAGMIRLALDGLIAKYSHPNPAAVLFPPAGMEGVSREEADKWRLALGLPASCVKQNADGTFCVVMDIGPLNVMLNSLPPNVYWITWDTAKFQAWQTGFNAQEERIKNMLQSFTQKYSNANSYHDNFNKTLSSHLNQFADMLKAMLNF